MGNRIGFFNINCGGSGASKGDDWTHKVLYTPDATNLNSEPIKIADDDLNSYFSKVDGTDERIHQVFIFKHNLFWWFPAWFGVWHEFALIQSTNWYWCFEKDTEGIRAQRSKNFDRIKHFYRGVRRTGTVRGEGRFSEEGHDGDKMSDVFDWLYRKDYLNHIYHLTRSNCHFFASLLFEAVARKKGRQLRKVKVVFYTENADSPGEEEEEITHDELQDWNIASDELITRVTLFNLTVQTLVLRPIGEDKEKEEEENPNDSIIGDLAIVESTNRSTKHISYWSFEKNWYDPSENALFWRSKVYSDGIAVQRGNNFETLIKTYRGKRRPWKLVQENAIEINYMITVQNIFEWIHSENLLHKEDAFWNSFSDNFGPLLCDAISGEKLSQ